MQALKSTAIAERLGAALRQWANQVPNAHKRISRWINVHPRNFKTYADGLWNPPLAKVIELAAICPEYADTLFDMIEERRRALNWLIASERVSAVHMTDLRQWFGDVRAAGLPDLFVIALSAQNDAALLAPPESAAA